jgi:RNA-binding protein 26
MACLRQGLSKGSQIPTIGVVQISWHGAQPPSTTKAASTAPTPARGEPANGDADRDRSPEAESQHEVEEETHRGWGDDDTEGMGMF